MAEGEGASILETPPVFLAVVFVFFLVITLGFEKVGMLLCLKAVQVMQIAALINQSACTGPRLDKGDTQTQGEAWSRGEWIQASSLNHRCCPLRRNLSAHLWPYGAFRLFYRGGQPQAAIVLATVNKVAILH